MTDGTRHSISRRGFLAASTVVPAAAWLGAAGVATAADRRRPNVVVVLADDVGYGELGCYGQSRMRTPALDQLAAEGVRFTEAYAGGPVCAPSRCSLLTGLHTGHSSVRTNPQTPGAEVPLRRHEPTVGTVLAGAGYRTACIGKWGMVVHPFDAGFDEFFGYLTHNEAHDYFPPYLWDGRTTVAYPENAGRNVTYAPDLLLARAQRFIADAGDTPFCLLFTPTLAHAPGELPDLTPYQNEPWPTPQKAHAAQVTRLDGQVRALLETLRAEGHDQDTLVLFAGDNGPHHQGVNPDFFDANGPLRGYKRNLYEGGIRVPMIAWGPGVLGTARAQPGPVAFWDLLPTLADLCGAEAPGDLDGVSVRHLLTGGPPAHHPPLYWQRLDVGVSGLSNQTDGGRGGQLCEAVRDGDWKLIRFAPGRDRYVPDDLWEIELYDLATDLGETRDVAADNPEVVRRLLVHLRAAYREASWVRTAWRPGGLTAVPPVLGVIGAGGDAELRTEFADPHATDGRVTLAVPAGWSAEQLGRPEHPGLGRPRPVRTRWRVRVPAGVAPGPADLVATARFVKSGTEHSVTLPIPVRVVPAAPATTAYLSDLPWDSAVNGLGPVERDASNGGAAAGDGTPISLAGIRYPKGLGCHSPARIAYHLGGACERFTATVGIDDVANASAKAVVAVVADGAVVYRSGLLSHGGAPVSVNVDVTGTRMLELVAAEVRRRGGDLVSWGEALMKKEESDVSST